MSHFEAQCFRLQRLYFGGVLAINECQPLRHVGYGVILNLSAFVLDLYVEGVVSTVFLIDIDGVLAPLKGVLLLQPYSPQQRCLESLRTIQLFHLLPL